MAQREAPPAALACGEPQVMRILGVDYTHFHLGEDGDLYLTRHGLPLIDCLLPINHWADREWFDQNATRLLGTSSIYRVRTKPANGKQRDIVIKWNRMGQEIPGDEFVDAQFNSPFEEFSLVTDLRDADLQRGPRVYTQKPLAIFVPATRLEIWRTGRKEYVMQSKIDKHVEIELDMHRLYAVIYAWIGGLDAVEAQAAGLLDEATVETLTRAAHERIEAQGFTVVDRKPHHVIVRPRPDGKLLRDRDGGIQYAMVDYELLQRTATYEREVRQGKRSDYLRKQRDRFSIETPKVLPSHLHYMNVLGVGYIYGEAQSTGGELWVVGKDPDLFDYFLPERWEKSPRIRLSSVHEAFYIKTKDNINLTWKVSRVGLVPDVDPFKEDERAILDFGYNSPFEEVAIAVRLSKGGVPTTYPRAVYRAGLASCISGFLFDPSRYSTHQHLVTPRKTPVLAADADYITIWGYWNGPDEKLAAQDGDYVEGINALRALRERLIDDATYVRLMQGVHEKLTALGVEDLNLRGTHILLSRRVSSGELVRGLDGSPEARICNFELLRMTRGWGE
jgi:hypothetical protein